MSRLAALVLALCACSFEPGTLAPIDAAPVDTLDAAAPRATLFVADYAAGVLYRYRVTQAELAPTSDLSISVSGALSPMLMPNGELWLSELSNARIDRYASPLETPLFIEAITGHGLPTQIAKMAIVDTEVWLVTAANSSVMRLGLGTEITDAGTFPISNGRGIVFDGTRRMVWVSQCCGSNAIARYSIASDRTPTYIDLVTTGGLNNPHGMVITPWGELLVANHANNNILRYSLDAAGIATFTGTITSSELTQPLDLFLTSWNELFVTSLDGGRIARFQFDATRAAVARPSIGIEGAQTLGYLVGTP